MNKFKAIVLLIAVLLLVPTGDAFAQRKKKKSTKQPNPNLTHLVGWYGAAGYSNLLHDIDMTKSVGGATGALGFEYVLQYKKCFSFTTGLEAMLFNSFTNVDPFKYKADFQYIDGISNTPMEYYFDFNNYREGHNKLSLNLPVKFGAQFGKVFFALGAKAEVNLWGFYGVNSNVHGYVVDPELIDDLASMPTHNISDFTVSTLGNTLQWGGIGGLLDVAATAELGLVMDEWMPATWLTIGKGKKAKKVSYRLSLFADYGVININKNTKADISERPLLNFKGKDSHWDAKNRVWSVDMANREALDPNSLIASNRGISSEGTPVKFNHTLVVGAKFAMLFDVTPEPKPVRRPPKPRPKPKPVQISPDPPFFYCVVTDAETQLPLDATVTLSRVSETGETLYETTTDTVTGFAQYQMLQPQSQLKGQTFALKVSREGYFDFNDTLPQINSDTILVELTPIKIDVPIILHNLLFDTDKAEIKNTSVQSLEDMYQLLVDRPELEVEISGHTDNVGSDRHNKKLSERRAKAVYDEMVKRGIDPSRMTYRGAGMHEPIDTNDTDEGRANNRRVEFRITNEVK